METVNFAQDCLLPKQDSRGVSVFFLAMIIINGNLLSISKDAEAIEPQQN